MKKNILFILLITFISLVGYSQQTISLGILSDFEKTDERSQFINKMLLEEIQKVTGSRYNVSFNKENHISCNWDKNQAITGYKKLSSSCDLIILIGELSVQGALNNQPIFVPTIGLGVFNTDIQQIPFTKEETSGINNFSYILTSQNVTTELMEFKKLIDYKNLVFLFDERTYKSIDQAIAQQKITKIGNSLNSVCKVISIDNKNIAASLAKIDQNTDAVYIGIPYEFSSTEIKEVLSILNEKQIPTLSMNHRYVNGGALISYSKDNSISYLTRKMALMADDALNGEQLSKMKVSINKKRELSLNVSTARKINFSPSFETLFTANIINDSSFELPSYSIQEIVKKALETNLDIQLSNMDISLSENDIKYAKSQFSPDASINASGTWIDKNRPNPIIGQAERSIVGNGKVQQLLYSESAIANIKIQKYIKEAQKYATAQEILTQILNCYTAYFSILKAKTNATIQSENLKAYKTNLELAKVRSNIGSNSNSDVYRWESEVANTKQAVIEAQTNIYISKCRLNTLLNLTLKSEFDVKDILLDDEIFKSYSKSVLSKSVTSPAKLESLTDFLINEAKNKHPSANQLLANLNAVDRQIIMNKRMYYTPTVALSGQIDQNFYRGGLGSEPLPDYDFFNTTGSTSIVVSYPLFDGNRRKINLQKSKIQHLQLSTQIDNLNQNLALQVRINTINLLTSGTKINYSKTSAKNTKNNFDLVQENYKQGTVSITQLIDAQKAAFTSQQAYSLSIYNYLLDFLTLENSIGFYSMLNTEEENAAFENRYLEHIKNN